MDLNIQDNVDLKNLTKKKIIFGEELLESIEIFKEIEGSQKLTRKINQELKFLRKALKNNSLKKEHLQCSNLTHFSALIDTLRNVEKCQSVNKVFLLDDRKITVDIISDGGLTWTKVVARNPKSVSQICLGNASYGVRSIIDQADEYVQCAKLYPCLFQSPKIVFVFTNGIGSHIAAKLESQGVFVHGERVSDHPLDSDSDSNEEDRNMRILNVSDLSTKYVANINKLNLDVSAMLAYCSSLTNGSAKLYDFNVPVLKQHAEWERLKPQKPILDSFLKDKKLYCCQTAKDNFVNIVETVGGPSEQIRAEELLSRLIVLPDDADYTVTNDDEDFKDIFDKVQYSDEKILKVGGKIKKRSLIIFTFGDRIKAVTVTANDGFVRAAKQQGINFVVFIHESRALTEQKEKSKAILIENETSTYDLS